MLECTSTPMRKTPKRWTRLACRGSPQLEWSLASLLLLLARCQPDYPLAPTACDDWCYATQRAACEEDYPEGCVSDCEEKAIGRRVPRCEPPWRALTDCYRAAPDGDFRCVADESHPLPICAPERTALADCVSPTTGSCVASCLREAAECPQPARDCEDECRFLTPGCDAAERALYQCRLAQAVDCRAPGADQRPPEQIPCLPETLTLLACAGIGPGSPPPDAGSP
jgi:hypothetical protein